MSGFRSRLPTVAIATVVIVTVVVSLALRQSLPEWVIADAGHDDQLFVRGAFSLSHGGWLGGFDDRTLLKGPGFPIWLAVVDWLPVPFLLVNQAFHLTAAALTSVATSRATRSRGFGVVCFVALALDPSFLGPSSSRITRDDWYSSICLLLFAVLALALTSPVRARSTKRLVIVAGTYGVVLGGTGGFYWLGREERPWLLPSLALMIVLLGVRAARRRESSGRVWRDLAPYVATLVVAAVVASSLVALTMEKNRRAYGSALVTDFADGAFVGAYGRWQSVEAGPARRYVPVSTAQRNAVYAVSPAAAELEPSLEGPLKDWVGPGCGALGICDDFAGGWFPFAFRDAVAAAGYYTTAASSQAFYQRLSAEIDSACASGRLRCGHRPSGLLPPTDQIHPGSVWSSARSTFSFLRLFLVGEPSRPISSGAPPNYALFEGEVVGLPLTLPEQQRQETAAERHWSGIRRIIGLYHWSTTPLLPLALLGYVLALWRRRGLLVAWTLGVAAGVCVLSRVSLLALIDATSFPAARSPYVLPASGFFIVFVAIGVWLMFVSWPARMRPSRGIGWQRATPLNIGPSSDDESPA